MIKTKVISLTVIITMIMSSFAMFGIINANAKSKVSYKNYTPKLGTCKFTDKSVEIHWSQKDYKNKCKQNLDNWKVCIMFFANKYKKSNGKILNCNEWLYWYPGDKGKNLYLNKNASRVRFQYANSYTTSRATIAGKNKIKFHGITFHIKTLKFGFTKFNTKSGLKLTKFATKKL